MPSKTAKQLCPELIFVYPRFSVYKEVSRSIREIFGRHTDIIEPLSLDEAYLDVTTDKQGIGSAIVIAQQIRKAIKDELSLTASAGVSVNKFVAKIASGMQKPDGLTFIAPALVEQFMEQLPVEKFFGVGKVTAERMRKMGLLTGADIKRLTEQELTDRFGKTGRFYYNVVRGIDNREVEPTRETKSIGAEDTFPHDLTSIEEMNKALETIAGIVYERLLKSKLAGRTLTLKVKYHDFRQITRSKSLLTPINPLQDIIAIACELVESAFTGSEKVRLLGITLSNFGELQLRHSKKKDVFQLELFC
jgi:DNA polymerase-4